MKIYFIKNWLQHIRTLLRSILWNWQTLLLFELLYKILGGVFLFPLLQDFLNFTVKDSNLDYINLDNIKIWILSPLTIPVLILCIIILSIYIMIEMSVIVEYFYTSHFKIKIGLFNLLKSTFKKIFHILRPRNWLLLFLVMVIFPITTFALTPDSLMNLRIPEYIVDFIKEKGAIYSIYIILLIGLQIIVFYIIFSIPIFILEDLPFIESCKKSYKMMKNKFFNTLLNYILLLISMLFVFLLICGLFLIFNIIKYRYINYTEYSINEFLLSYIQLKQYSSFIFNILTFIISFAFIMNRYFEYSGQNEINIKPNKTKSNSIVKILLSIAEIILIIISIGIYLDYQGNAFTLYYFNNKQQEIAAHRAGSTFAPENTLVALDQAIKSDAAYAEIDVQQSKDGELIILHDTNFKRTTGVDKNVWDVNYDEIKTYDAGIYDSHGFKDVKVPTLEEMIQKADGKIKLMIELKTNGHEINLLEDVIDLIKKYNFENQCVIASMDLEILSKSKKLDSNIKTAYISAVAYGEYYNIDYIDIFSIESTFVNKDVINRIHSNNKKIFVWTINKDESIKKILSLHVDGIVTDNPELAKYYRDLGSRDIFINDLMEKLFFNNPQ